MNKRKRMSCYDEEVEKHIWMDADGLSVDCGVCFMPFEAQVFMCQNGHAACARCCVGINGKCWCCGEPIGAIRCRPLENVLADMNSPCRFREHGCEEILKYVDKRRHEETCTHAPRDCPVCDYRGVNLYGHLLGDHTGAVAASVAYLQTATVSIHKDDPFRVLVMERAPYAAGGGEGSVFLLLNGGATGGMAGRSLSLVCLAGPVPEGNGDGGGVEISYKMEVRGNGEPAAAGGALSMAATAPCVRYLEGVEAKIKMFLVVPEAVWVPSGSVSVSIRLG